jgi:hypothetical protein
LSTEAYWYGQALLQALKGTIDLETDPVKVMLTTSSYTPNQDTHIFKSSVTGEVSGTGYTAGGKAISNLSMTYTAATNTITITGDPVEWANSTITARYAVIYVDKTGADSVKPLLGYVDFGSDKISSDGLFKIQWHTDGIFKITKQGPV